MQQQIVGSGPSDACVPAPPSAACQMSLAVQNAPAAKVIIAAIGLQIKEKRLTLPALCGCPHDLSPLSPQYPNACAINCPLYQNAALHGKLLQNMLQSYDL